MKQTKNIIGIFLVTLTLLIAIFSNITSVNALPSVDIDELDGNILNNPHIRYTEQDNLIPHWDMVVTNNIFGGSSVVTGLKETVNGRRATNVLSGFEVSSSNQSNEFTSYISGGKESDGFFLLGQTYSNITKNKTYIFRTEIRGNARVVMNIYPGKSVSGEGVIHTREIQASNEVQVLEIEFRTQLTEITLSFRHMAGSANETFVNIRGAAFIDKESYIKQQFVKSITEYIKNEEDFNMDSTIESLINDGAKDLTEQSTNEEIELKYSQTLEDVHYYLMINNLKNYNDTFNTKITFDENLFVHLKDGLTIQNYRERLAIAREINLNLYKNKLNTALLSYSQSLDENFSQNEKLIAIIDEHRNQLNENPNYDDIYNEAKIKIDNEYLLYKERIRINNELDNLFSTYLSDLYTAENYQKLEKIIDDAKNEVDNNSNLEELQNYNLEEVSKLLNSIKTKLDEAKDQLRDEILENYPEEDYSEENYQEIKDKIDEFLDGLTDIDEVENFELEGSTLEDELEDVKTKLDEAKDQLRDEILDNYPEEDYSEENYQEIKDKIDEFLDGLTDIDEVENFELEGSPLEDELEDVKTKLDEAKDQLRDEILDNYPEEDYSEENYQEIKDKIDEFLDGLTDIDEVENFELEGSPLEDELEDVKTKLDEAKDQLRDEILENYPEEDYSEENYQEIKDKIDEFLDGLTDIDEVENFELEGSTLEDELEDVKTKLDEAKDQLRDEILDNYPEEDYSEENYQEIKDKIDEFLDGLTDIDEVENFELEGSTLEDELEDVKTKLDEAKDQLRDEILDNYPEEDYSEENYQEIKDKIDEFLDGLTDIDEVENFELEGSTLEDELEDVKTKLDEAKDQLRDEILDNYPEEDYSEENYQEIKDKIDEFLDGLTDIDEVENFELEGSTLKDELDDIKNLEEELADLKEEAKKDLDDFIKDLVDENTTKEELDEILKEFEDKINNAKDKEELDHIWDDVKKELENQKEINDKNKDLDDFVDGAEDSDKYGDLGQKLIDDILKELEKSLSEKLTREEILDLIIEALEKLRAVKIYNLSSVEGITPNGNYNSQEILDDLYAYIESTEGVKSSVNLKASVKDLINEQTIREMIRKGLIIPKNSQDLNQLIKTLNKQSIFGLIDISLYDDEVKYTEYNGVYTVNLLLPRNLRTHTNLSVLYKGIEKVEVFEVETNGDWITFKTDHFSEFYLIGDSIVGEQTVNLWWLIITLLIIITLEIVVIVILKVKNKSTKAYSVSFLPLLAVLPTNAITWITILSIIIILLAIYIIYLILQTNQKVKVFEQKEEVEIVNKEAETPKVLIQERDEPLYNYSFTSRLHMADEKAMDRFNELKNYVLSYEGVTVSTTWRQETYLFKNKSVFKVRINGKTLNAYFNLNLNDFKDTKYIFIDRSDVKTHQSTPLQYVINGPRKLNWPKELIDYYMKENGGNKKDKYTYVNYKVEPLTRNTLIRRGLIKVTGATKEYQDMISGSK